MEAQQEKPLFDGIVGYEGIKKELTIRIDAFNNPRKYWGEDIPSPTFLLFEGFPGLGKTLFANKVMQALDGKHIIIRRTSSHENMFKKIKEGFEDALASPKAVILLDDLDKFFGDKDSGNDYGIIQAYLDRILEQGKKVFVLATTNDILNMPASLLREGRFKTIYFSMPDKQVSDQLVLFYLRGVNLDSSIDQKTLTSILYRKTCAGIKEIIEQARLISIYEGKEHIDLYDIIRAYLTIEKDVDVYSPFPENKNNIVVAYHEAAHAFIQETFFPNSVGFLALTPDAVHPGFMMKKANLNDTFEERDRVFHKVQTDLAGKAMTEIKFHGLDKGISSDIEAAIKLLKEHFSKIGADDFEIFKDVYPFEEQQDLSYRFYEKCRAIMNSCYQEDLAILSRNIPMIDKLVEAVMNHPYHILLGDDIKKILQSKE